MKKGIGRILFWTPRILCVLFAAFLSLFALDVLSEGSSFGDIVLALIIHLVPVYVVVIVLVIAWRWEWVGAILFTGLALFYLIWSWGRFHWSAYLGISGPLVLLGVLFLLNWIYRAQLRRPKLLEAQDRRRRYAHHQQNGPSMRWRCWAYGGQTGI